LVASERNFLEVYNYEERERERERERVISDIANGDDNVVDTRKRGEKNDREKKRRSEGIYAELATKE
jgi:hypothetical protein